ncbi:MAG: hypothetical protein ACI9TB_002541, partial [Parasphingorhabdus sp.]
DETWLVWRQRLRWQSEMRYSLFFQSADQHDQYIDHCLVVPRYSNMHIAKSRQFIRKTLINEYSD